MIIESFNAMGDGNTRKWIGYHDDETAPSLMNSIRFTSSSKAPLKFQNVCLKRFAVSL